jgi:transcriptional regulator, merR family
MKSVKEVSQLSGVSVRTLHYYDEIDLLKPSMVAENGYRYYNRDAIIRLQEILLYRELDFPLKQIKELVSQDGYDKAQALKDQIQLLELKKSRLEAIISHAKALQMEEEEMSFEAFDQKTLEEFQQEAQARWGQTEAYQTFEAKGETVFPAVTKEMTEIMQAFGALRHGEASAQEAQDRVKVLQDYISEHFYPCNQTILAGLGQMYTEDNRFTTFIDQAGGTGTAAFVAKAISIYCQP